jgi:hypothetical protein
MGGKRSGFTTKRKTLSRRYVSGQLDRADRRAPEVRATIEGAQAIIEDRGGEATASFLLQRAAYRTMHLDMLLSRDELKLAQGKDVDRAEYLAAADSWLRYAKLIGLERRARQVRLAEYLARRQGGDKPAPATTTTVENNAAPGAANGGTP